MNLSHFIAEYIQLRCSDKLEKQTKAEKKELEIAEKAGQDTAPIEQQKNEQKAALLEAHKPVNWLTDASKRASQISLVTHAAKFSHSDSKASGFTAAFQEPDHRLLGTHSLSTPAIDVVGNAAALDVANLLLLEGEGVSLWQQIQAGNTKSLECFTNDKTQLSDWLSGFREALETTQIRSHSLSKQVYFQIAVNEYHLISPLFPSSLADRLYSEIREAKFGDVAKQAREARKKGIGSPHDIVDFPDLLTMNYGGSKPQNISLLNSRRRGQSFLFNSAPPYWEDKLIVPLKHKNSLWTLLDRRTRKTVNRLRRFLGEKAHQANNDTIKKQRAAYVTEIVDQFIVLVAEIRRLGNAGWTADSTLPLAEQCLLDPDRRALVDQLDDEFIEAYDTKSWLDSVADQFGLWLNNRLSKIKTDNGETLDNLGDSEQHVWRQELDNRIAHLRNDLECLL